jgi:NAD(P)-dependent dehydrogenase (short-subunit alcohol dehydrogenase family)
MVSHTEFGEATSALEVAEVFKDRIKGKNGTSTPYIHNLCRKLISIVLITGVSPNGVGQGTAAAFASQGPANLLLLSRTKEKLESVATNLRKEYPGVPIKTIIIDLGSQQSVRDAASEVANTVSKLDILVNNAGAVIHTRKWTPEKIEFQFGANHIGPFLLTNLLLPLLLEAASESEPGQTRIVSLSSGGHRISPIRFHDWNIEGKEVPTEEEFKAGLPPAFLKKTEDGYLSIVAYSQSKTANILFTVYLQQHLPGKGIAAYTLHPGGRFIAPCHPPTS